MGFDELWQDNNFRHDHDIPGIGFLHATKYSLQEVKRIAKLFYEHGIKESLQQAKAKDQKILCHCEGKPFTINGCCHVCGHPRP